MIYPVITIKQPWASRIARAQKTIETRTHSRFKRLKGKTILIHVGAGIDRFEKPEPGLPASVILCRKTRSR